MQDLYDKLLALDADDVDSTALFEHVADIAKLKNGDPALWAKLWLGWKSKGVAMLTELGKQVDAKIRDAKKAKRVKRSEGDFERDEDGKVIPNRANSLLAIEKMGVTLRHDLFAGTSVIEGLPKMYGTSISDTIVDHLWASCEERFGFRPSVQNFRTWITEAGFRNGYHPVVDYLAKLEWDGTKRIDTWLTTYFQAENNPYTRAVGAIWLMAGVKRVRQPGVKFDEMIILEGAQGGGKSKGVAVMAVRREWFSDSVQLGASEQKMIESTMGVWVFEIAEMVGHRKGDVEKNKAQMSRTTDRARLAYAHFPTRHERQSVGIITYNPPPGTGYLVDPTGNRRFWPVTVHGPCDLEALRRDRDQLWAEAASREREGDDAQIRLPRELWPLAAKEQAARMVDSAFVDVLASKLGNMQGYITAEDGWRLLGVPVERRDSGAGKYGAAWKTLGWTRHNWRINGVQTNVYVKGDETGRRIVAEEMLFGSERGQMHAVYEGSGG